MTGNFKTDVDRPYSNGREASIWHLYIGSAEKRIQNYKSTLLEILEQHDAKHVLDAACATGIDSALLIEEGYCVNSTDACEPFLKEAREMRWRRRHDPGFEDWSIGLGDWLDLRNCEKTVQHPVEGYDAILCIGNSFCCLPDFEGNQITLKKALSNFNDLLKPGGVLIIDHRNYDYVIKNCVFPPNSHESIYYNSNRIFNVTTTVSFVNGKCEKIETGMYVDLTGTDLEDMKGAEIVERDGKKVCALLLNTIPQYPHTLQGMTALLKEVFTPAQHRVLPDFKETKEEGEDPVYCVHVVTKPS